MTIRWLIRVTETFVQIYDYYSETNSVYARRFYFKVIEGVNMITKFPMSAPKEFLLEKNKKEFRALLIMKRFKVIYYVKNETIFIFDIWDCRQNPNTLIQELR